MTQDSTQTQDLNQTHIKRLTTYQLRSFIHYSINGYARGASQERSFFFVFELDAPQMNNSKWETIHFVDNTYGVTNSVEFQTMTVHFGRFRGGGCGYQNSPISEELRHDEWSTRSGLQLSGK